MLQPNRALVVPLRPALHSFDRVHNSREASSRRRESCRDGLCCVKNPANSPAPKNTYSQQKHKHTQTKRAHKSKTRTSPIGRGLTGIRASEGVQTALPTHTLGVLLHLQRGVLLHLLIGAPLQIGVLRRLLIGFEIPLLPGPVHSGLQDSVSNTCGPKPVLSG